MRCRVGEWRPRRGYMGATRFASNDPFIPFTGTAASGPTIETSIGLRSGAAKRGCCQQNADATSIAASPLLDTSPLPPN